LITISYWLLAIGADKTTIDYRLSIVEKSRVDEIEQPQ
jgi:hypothetical protein